MEAVRWRLPSESINREVTLSEGIEHGMETQKVRQVCEATPANRSGLSTNQAKSSSSVHAK